ncbi:MAG TPA: TIR domain-containing protein [Opitutaceae bacterium]|nr:TIR domain-containing protein [Opitutaceae bacterium]
MPSDPPRAVFLSYAREDTDAARRIADALRAFGLEVWFDQNELRGGDAWDQKIRRQIKECALFLPIISAHTQERGEGYFRREWRLGVERTHDMAAGVAFIVPVVVDETPADEATVPEEFLRFQWTRLSHGVPSAEFVEQIKRLLEAPRKPTGGFKAAPVRDRLPRGPQRSARPGWIWGALVVVVIAGSAAVFFAMRQPAPSTPSAPPSPSTSLSTTLQPDAKSIAVLPFENMSEDKDNSAFFADGIHEDILTNLALIRELHVISRTSVMQYRGTTKSIKQIAQELGVAYVLEGSVRRAGNRVRVTGQLIDARTDEHVWAKAYDRDLTDVFTIQGELAQAIAGALSAALSPQEKSLLERRLTENLAAYDAYVKARELRERAISEDQKEIEPLLQKAVQLDPKFAAAWAELGAFYAYLYFNEEDHTADRLAKAKTAIDAAVRLAPDAPEVIEKLGDYYYYGYRDYARAIEQYQRLAVLRPKDVEVFGSLGLIYRRQGRWGDALSTLRRAVQIEPRNLRYVRTLQQLAQALNLWDEAEAVQRHVVELQPDSLPDAAFLALVPFLARGSTKEGLDWIARTKPASPQEGLMLYLRKTWARLTGDFKQAIRLDQQQQYFDGLDEPHWSQDINAAFVLAASGDMAAARARAEPALSAMKAELEKQPTSAGLWVGLSGGYALLGDRTQALRAAQKAMELVPESTDAVAGPTYSENLASCLAYLGDKDRALAELARLLRTPYGENIYVAKYSPTWFPLHGDPRFEALVDDPKNNAPLF